MGLNLGVIGTGYWGSNIVRIFSELKSDGQFDGDLYLYDIKEGRAKIVADKYGFKFVDSFNVILDDNSIQAVLIVTPSSTHYKYVKDLLIGGKDVYVEKPFTLDEKKAKELVELSMKTHNIVMVGHIFRYHDGLLELKKRMKLGEFGKIHFLYGFKFGLSIPKEDSGVIFTLAVNDFDIFCFLLDVDYPKTISAQRGTFIQTGPEKDYEDIVNVAMEFENNTHGYFIESWLVPVFGRRRELVVVGSEKTAIIDYLKPNEMLIYDVKVIKDDIEPGELMHIEQNFNQKVVLEFIEPLKKEIMHFIDCIITRKTPKSDINVAYRSIKMCDIGMKSAKTGIKLKIKDEMN